MSKVANVASEAALAELASMAPQADTYNRVQFPKLVFNSTTKLDDDDKVVTKAGTFFIDRPTDKEDDNGKVVWDREEIGSSLECHILYMRNRLSYWDDDAGEFHSTPMFDNSTEVVPLFKAGQFVAEGTPAELKGMYAVTKEYTDEKTGEKKPWKTSELRDGKVLFILYKEELLELTIQKSALKSFNKYFKSVVPALVITEIDSTKEKNGSLKWNQMKFKNVRPPTEEEAVEAVKITRELIDGIEEEKSYYAAKRAANAVAPIAAPEAGALAAGKNEDF